MKTREALTVLARHRGDAIVVCALGMAANEWWAVTKSEDSFYMHGGMGLASTFALGLALSIPETPVWVINSDGGLCMNTGTLITEAGQQPRNMKHFVVDNQCYQTVETMPIVNQDGADYTMMAKGAGFQRAITIDNAADKNITIAPDGTITVHDTIANTNSDSDTANNRARTGT